MDEKGFAYVLTSGEYSDYTVHAVYTDKEQAEKIAAEAGWEVEDYPLNQPLTRHEQWSCVVSIETGEIVREGTCGHFDFGSEPCDAAQDQSFRQGLTYSYPREWENVAGYSYRGPDAARKVAFEARQRELAKIAAVA